MHAPRGAYARCGRGGDSSGGWEQPPCRVRTVCNGLRGEVRAGRLQVLLPDVQTGGHAGRPEGALSKRSNPTLVCHILCSASTSQTLPWQWPLSFSDVCSRRRVQHTPVGRSRSQHIARKILQRDSGVWGSWVLCRGLRQRASPRRALRDLLAWR